MPAVDLAQTGVLADFDEVFFGGVIGTSVDVPGVYDVSIGAHPYMIDTTFEFGRRDSFRHSGIPAQRTATDITNQPGEGTINPQGLWRSEMNDWSLGSGQLYLDRPGSVPNRFLHSQGLDVFSLKWRAMALADTQLLVADTDPACRILVVNGYVYKLNSTGVSYSSGSGFAPYHAVAGLSGTPVSMTTDGNNVYIACGTGGVYSTAAGSSSVATHLVNVTSNNVYFVAYAANCLLVANSNSIYQVTAAITTFPTALMTARDTSWKWTTACAGNGWIYMGGYSGGTLGTTTNFSAVYKTQMAADGTTLSAPTVATLLAPGEVVYSLFAFVNYILLGTSLGMRFCQTLGLIDPSGQDTGLLKIGPVIPNLTEPATLPVRCFTSNQRFAYFGWSNFAGPSGPVYDVARTGIGVIDIATFTGEQTPAYATHLSVAASGEITSMDWLTGLSNALYQTTESGTPIFTVSGQGVYAAQNNVVPKGYVTTSNITFRIPDQKILIAVSGDGAANDTSTPPFQNVAATIYADDAVGYNLGVTTGYHGQFNVPNVSAENFKLVATLISNDVGGTLVQADGTSQNGAQLRRLTLMAYPAITAGNFFIAALRFYDVVEVKGGGRRSLDVYGELAYLDNLRQTQVVVAYQEGSAVYQVVVDDVDMVWYKASTLPRGGFQGVAMVTMKSATSGIIT